MPGARTLRGPGADERLHSNCRVWTTITHRDTIQNCITSQQILRLIPWGCSSAGRAPGSQSGGRGFDPRHLHNAGKPLFSRSSGVFLCGRIFSEFRFIENIAPAIQSDDVKLPISFFDRMYHPGTSVSSDAIQHSHA